ncbi:MAG: DNA polymerase subunit beta [Anaerolineaceae bacterium]|nr:DNA polymerase subunit beta [Anaerolineaceae bacterium]
MTVSDTALNALPPDKQLVVTAILAKLTAIAGVRAVVLGGSWAHGTQTSTSDIDLGLYYDEKAPFDIAAVRRVAAEVSVDGEPVVTEFYEWGAWVNGGAWIHTAGGKVDFLYRNLDQVRRVIAEARAGKTTLDYLQQPPYGFRSVIYLAETSICLPLYDPDHLIAELKQAVVDYPPKLKESVIQGNLWSVEFTLLHARTFASRADVYNTVGCLTRALSALTQVLFALNETYFISDKRAIDTIETFGIRPEDYRARVERILAHPGADVDALSQTVAALDELFRQVVDLAGAWYQPKYGL